MEIRHILKPVTKDSIDLVIHNPDGYDERVDEAISTINDLLLGNKKNIKSRLPFHISFNPGLKKYKIEQIIDLYDSFYISIYNYNEYDDDCTLEVIAK